MIELLVHMFWIHTISMYMYMYLCTSGCVCENSVQNCTAASQWGHSLCLAFVGLTIRQQTWWLQQLVDVQIGHPLSCYRHLLWVSLKWCLYEGAGTVNMYMYMHVYTCRSITRTRMHAHTHTHTHTHTYTHTHTHTHTHTPQANSPGDNTTRTSIPTSKYTQVVIYDHITRRKA